MRTFLKRMLKRTGYELIRYRPHVEDILTRHKFDVVLDVGANVGQFAVRIRSRGFNGRIVSFEPVKESFEELATKSKREGNWIAVNAGLGQTDSEETMNVARSSVYSSLLRPRALIENFAGPAIEISAREQVVVRTLDSLYSSYVHNSETVFLKIDTQGFEKQVLYGAISSLKHIKGVQVELSLSPLYEGEASLEDVTCFLQQCGFSLALIDPVTYDSRKGILLQVDCIFIKNNFGPFAK